jgi:translation initiation factor RLI1
MQADDPLPLPKGNFLAELSIADSIAENEFQTLGGYYLRTDQFGRASRGEVNLVVGRKGAGKTALFSQLRNEKRANVRNIVVDLKPEGYQLIRLKEDVLDFLAEGARTHLITALFEYVFYLEICYKLLEKDREKHLRDNRIRTLSSTAQGL